MLSKSFLVLWALLGLSGALAEIQEPGFLQPQERTLTETGNASEMPQETVSNSLKLNSVKADIGSVMVDPTKMELNIAGVSSEDGDKIVSQIRQKLGEQMLP